MGAGLGTFEVLDLPDALEPLVEYYRSISGEHPDWDEYGQAMVAQGKSLLRLTIERVGTHRHRRVPRPPRDHVTRGEPTVSDQAGDDCCYLSTTGRCTTRPHRIEIWYATDGVGTGRSGDLIGS